MRGKRTTGISSEVRNSVSTIAVLLALPVIAGLFVMILYSSRYHGMIRRMDAAAELKPALETELAEDLFSVAAGRTSFEKSGVLETIHRIDNTLDTLTGQTEGNGHLQLTIARRTMDTMEQYTLKVRDGMTQRKPVDEIESIVDEVRDVGSLVANMLDAFITEEIANATATSRNLHQWMWASATAEVILLIYALWYSRFKTNRMTESIRSSLGSMENAVRRIAEGHFGERVSGVNVDELEELGEHINEMANQLEALMQETRQKTDHLAKAELRTMQAQINPHFLYNTLDAIIWMTEAGETRDAISMTQELSNFFRISLSKGKGEITIKNEMEHIKSYLEIQHYRYRDIMDYEIDFDEDILGCYIQKLTLQPIVENALYHGVKNKRGVGHIKVTGRAEGDNIVLITEDDGIGMKEEELERLRSLIKGDIEDDTQDGFGMANVEKRIEMQYGPEYGITVESEYQKGTVVRVLIPRVESVGQDSDEKKK
jgi:two-component system sensor histidine kinase YesM